MHPISVHMQELGVDHLVVHEGEAKPKPSTQANLLMASNKTTKNVYKICALIVVVTRHLALSYRLWEYVY